MQKLICVLFILVLFGGAQAAPVQGVDQPYSGEPLSFDFKDMDVTDFFLFIADISGLNVIVDPGIRGTVTLKLRDVPWDQALDLVTKNQSLGYTLEGNVIRIVPLAKLIREEQARAQAIQAQFLSAPLVTIIKPLNYAKAQDIDRIVKRLLTSKGSSVIDPRTNTIIITDIGKNVHEIGKLIDSLE